MKEMKDQIEVLQNQLNQLKAGLEEKAAPIAESKAAKDILEEIKELVNQVDGSNQEELITFLNKEAKSLTEKAKAIALRKAEYLQEIQQKNKATKTAIDDLKEGIKNEILNESKKESRKYGLPLVMGIIFGILFCLIVYQFLERVISWGDSLEDLWTTLALVVGIILLVFLVFRGSLHLKLFGVAKASSESIFATLILPAKNILEAIAPSPIYAKIYPNIHALEQGTRQLIAYFAYRRMRTWLFGLFFSLILGLFAFLGTYLLVRQNELIKEQSYLTEAARRSSLVFMMSNIMDKVDEELDSVSTEPYHKSRQLSDVTIGRIAALSQGMKPIRYLEQGELVKKALSPERGQLLLALINSNLDTSETYPNLFQKTSFEKADLNNVLINGGHLINTQLRRANLEGATIENLKISGGTLEEANFQYSSLASINFHETQLRKVNFNNTNLSKVNIKQVELSKMKSISDFSKFQFENALISSLDIAGIFLYDFSFKQSTAIDLSIKDANLLGFNFEKSNILISDFSKSKFSICKSCSSLKTNELRNLPYGYVLGTVEKFYLLMDFDNPASSILQHIYNLNLIQNEQNDNSKNTIHKIHRPYLFSFEGSNFSNTNFNASEFEGIDFQNTTFNKCNFTNSVILYSNLKNVNIQRDSSKFKDYSVESYLSIDTAFEYEIDFNIADYTPMVFDSALISFSNLENLDLTSSSLSNTEFYFSRLDGINFREADLSGADFRFAIIGKLNIYVANLDNAQFSDIDWMEELEPRDAEYLSKYFDIDSTSNSFIFQGNQEFHILWEKIKLKRAKEHDYLMF